MSLSAVTRYPNLQGMMDLFRSMVNDDGGGMDGPQGGIIATNAAPFTLPFLNAAIRFVYRKLRNVGDPALILDNYLLQGIPALTGPNPAVQVSLGFQSYFDGFLNHPQWTLPAGAMGVDAVWERPSGVNANFTRVAIAAGGLQPGQQGNLNRIYEWRGNALWMPGALQAVDLRLRCKVALPPILGNSLNFATTYVPVLDADDAIVDRMLVLYARRFSPEMVGVADASSKESMDELERSVVLQAQRQERQRGEFGTEAVGDISSFRDL